MSYSGVNLTALMVMVILSRSIGSSLKSQPNNEQVATTSQENRSSKRIDTEYPQGRTADAFGHGTGTYDYLPILVRAAAWHTTLTGST
jgi:hypothetical protein